MRALVPLGHFSDEQLDLIFDNAKKVNVYRGQVLISPGEQNHDNFYLLSGHIKVLRKGFETSVYDIHAGTDTSLLPLCAVQPRQDKVVAISDCQLLKVEKVFLEKLLCWVAVSRALLAQLALDDHYKQDYFWIKKLLQSRLFYKIPPMNIYAVLNKFTAMVVAEGESVIHQGDEGLCCYLLKSGTAKVFVDGEEVANLTAGTVFGEDALVSQNKRNASIVMSTKGELMMLEKSDFHELLKTPDISAIETNRLSGFLKNGSILLDVRTQQEFDQGHYPQSINIPLHLSYLKSALLEKKDHYICYSASDERTCAAVFLLRQQGFSVDALKGDLNTDDVVSA